MLYLVLSFIVGFILGFGLMWYYWRRYKNTDAFKKEVLERALEIAQTVKKK